MFNSHNVLEQGLYILNNGPKRKHSSKTWWNSTKVTQTDIKLSLKEKFGDAIQFTNSPSLANFAVVPSGIREVGKKLRQRNPSIVVIPYDRLMQKQVPEMSTTTLPQYAKAYSKSRRRSRRHSSKTKKQKNTKKKAVNYSDNNNNNINYNNRRTIVLPSFLKPEGQAQFLPASYVQDIEEVKNLPLENNKTYPQRRSALRGNVDFQFPPSDVADTQPQPSATWSPVIDPEKSKLNNLVQKTAQLLSQLKSKNNNDDRETKRVMPTQEQSSQQQQQQPVFQQSPQRQILPTNIAENKEKTNTTSSDSNLLSLLSTTKTMNNPEDDLKSKFEKEFQYYFRYKKLVETTLTIPPNSRKTYMNALGEITDPKRLTSVLYYLDQLYVTIYNLLFLFKQMPKITVSDNANTENKTLITEEEIQYFIQSDSDNDGNNNEDVYILLEKLQYQQRKVREMLNNYNVILTREKKDFKEKFKDFHFGFLTKNTCRKVFFKYFSVACSIFSNDNINNISEDTAQWYELCNQHEYLTTVLLDVNNYIYQQGVMQDFESKIQVENKYKNICNLLRKSYERAQESDRNMNKTSESYFSQTTFIDLLQSIQQIDDQVYKAFATFLIGNDNESKETRVLTRWQNLQSVMEMNFTGRVEEQQQIYLRMYFISLCLIVGNLCPEKTNIDNDALYNILYNTEETFFPPTSFGRQLLGSGIR